MALGFGQSAKANAAVAAKKYEKGAVIVQEGSSAAEMYVLTQGSVGIYKNYTKFTQVDLGSVRVGECFGENSMFLGQSYPASYVALADSSLILIDSKSANDVFTQKPELAVSIMTSLTKRLDAATKSTSKPAEEAPVIPLSKSSSLFPQGHGSYSLPISNTIGTYLYGQNCTCPLCSVSFENLFVLTSRLKREATDKDLRVRYADIEPMYYDIITCPNCLYSATVDLFPKAGTKFAETLHKEINKFLTDTEIKVGVDRDTFTVFAGYYLALRCAPICFDEYQLITAGLWQKLSRIYKDCGDEKMYLTASQMAMQDYLHVYQKFYISDKQSQQICYILGDLSERLQDYDAARNYYFLAKSNRDGAPTLKLQADRRLEELKELKNNS